jgi:hypothetical protein
MKTLHGVVMGFGFIAEHASCAASPHARVHMDPGDLRPCESACAGLTGECASA